MAFAMVWAFGYMPAMRQRRRTENLGGLREGLLPNTPAAVAVV